jgi:predicted metalloprotease with PDZ domain
LIKSWQQYTDCVNRMIRYRIQPESPKAHIFRVELSIPNPDPNGERLTLPAWIPGSYMIRDFSRNILSLSTESDGELVKTEKVDKQTWHFPEDGLFL